MLFNYTVGMQVRLREDEDEKGVVYKLDPDAPEEGAIYVQWDDMDGPRWTELHDIMPDTPEATRQLADFNQKIQANIDEATSLLEQAFQKWRKANAMQAEGIENPVYDGPYFEGAYHLRGNPDLDLSKFERVVERNGWSTSSLYC